MPMSGSVGDVPDLSDHVERYLRGSWVSHGMAGLSPECVLGLGLGLGLKHLHREPLIQAYSLHSEAELQAEGRGLTPSLKLCC